MLSSTFDKTTPALHAITNNAAMHPSEIKKTATACAMRLAAKATPFASSVPCSHPTILPRDNQAAPKKQQARTNKRRRCARCVRPFFPFTRPSTVRPEKLKPGTAVDHATATYVPAAHAARCGKQSNIKKSFEKQTADGAGGTHSVPRAGTRP